MDELFNLVEPTSSCDFECLARLARQLAAYHGETFELSPVALQADYGAWYRAVLARSSRGNVVGYAGWHSIYAIQTAARAIELQNLFVDPTWRNCSIGRALVRHVAVRALDASAGAVRISIRKENMSAIAFYDRLGCQRFDRGANWVCRLDTDGMQRLIAHPH